MGDLLADSYAQRSDGGLPPCCGVAPIVFKWADDLFGIECQNSQCPHDNHEHALLCHETEYREVWEHFRVKGDL